MLATGTTQGDVLVPGFASMVHGRLGGGPMELLSASGVCACPPWSTSTRCCASTRTPGSKDCATPRTPGGLPRPRDRGHRHPPSPSPPGPPGGGICQS